MYLTHDFLHICFLIKENYAICGDGGILLVKNIGFVKKNNIYVAK
jgi:hypothetical protein